MGAGRLLSAVEKKRLKVSRNTEKAKKTQLGQFLTPETTAAFMASLFPDSSGDCCLLDAGAGIGALSAAFLDRWKAGGLGFRRVTLDAFEIDPDLRPYLSQTLEAYEGDDFTATVRSEDFIRAAVASLSGSLFAKLLPRYTHAILNPPYKKMGNRSVHRHLLQRVGIETVNLYSAFVALAVKLAGPKGQIVAIIPRSFCNGPYYRPFRDFILKHAAIRRLHLFDSRESAFKDDEVLQENIIIRLERGAQQGLVTVSTSTDDTLADLVAYDYPFDQIVFPDDSQQFIHVPTGPEPNLVDSSPVIRYSLADIGIQVSTGPVVDFRLKEHLRDDCERGSVPLLYPCHFRGFGTTWPISGGKKPNGIAHNADTRKWLYPNGFYCVVRRFSSKEEKRRIVASVVDPDVFGNRSVLGFENHINLFHQNKHGLPEALAYGLAAFLNTTAVDTYFRRFNGHTQVNAADLRQLKYPSREALTALGLWASQQKELTQTVIDAKLETLAG
jgi:adenine-specific DNA-methyltransferase